MGIPRISIERSVYILGWDRVFFLAPVVFFGTAVGLSQVVRGQIQWVMISGFRL